MESSSFTMSGGTIKNNKASSYGGGVYYLGSFTTSGGNIADNSPDQTYPYTVTLSYDANGGTPGGNWPGNTVKVKPGEELISAVIGRSLMTDRWSKLQPDLFVRVSPSPMLTVQQPTLTEMIPENMNSRREVTAKSSWHSTTTRARTSWKNSAASLLSRCMTRSGMLS